MDVGEYVEGGDFFGFAGAGCADFEEPDGVGVEEVGCDCGQGGYDLVCGG